MKAQFNGYVLDDAINAVDFKQVTHWLSGSYWSPRITQSEVEKGARHSSLVIGAYSSDGRQVGYGRIVSDRTRFAYIMDVFVDENHRGQGLAREMIRFAMSHPEYADVYQWLLATRDAHAVYKKLGFQPLEHPEWWMIIRREKSR
jgi:GNAT superfamily N-acetyltransferase